MSMTRSDENGDEEKKVSPAEQSVSSSYEAEFSTLRNKSKKEREQIINASPHKTEIEKGLQTLKIYGHVLIYQQIAVILAGRDAPVVADALIRLIYEKFLTNQNRMLVSKAGSDAINVSKAIIELNHFKLMSDSAFPNTDQSLYKLDTAEFLKVANAMLSAINNANIRSSATGVIIAF